MHRDLIAKLIHVMLALNFYKGFFEDSFLGQTEDFFEKDSSEKLLTLNVFSYGFILLLDVRLYNICRANFAQGNGKSSRMLRYIHEEKVDIYTTEGINHKA